MPLARLERPDQAPPGWRRMLADCDAEMLVNGVVSFVFSATGPVAVILSAATQGGLSEAQIASWLFGVFALNGVFTLALSWLYRQPLVFLWTIPGTVLVGQSLGHLSFAEVLGAFYLSGLLTLLLGLSGWVRRVMAALPMPIVMGMVAGVFLRFGIDLIRALREDLALAGSMLAVWLLLSAVPSWGRRVPPILGALVVGAAVMAAGGPHEAASLAPAAILARPVFETPAWSWAAMVELVLPIMITVLAVQNGQGIAVLRTAGHQPPVNAVTVACGIGALLSAAVGGINSCLTGPANAIIVASGQRGRHYIGGLMAGALAIAFGLMAPVFTRLMLTTPKTYIMALAGLSLLRVLQGAFAGAFKERFTLGALVAFLVTVADIGIANIGAAFWGLVAGAAVSWLLERADWRDAAGRR